MTTTRHAEHTLDFDEDVHIYEPHKAALPPVGRYAKQLWRRRQFMRELARTTLKAQHFDTFFGQAWLVINPLMLAVVYYVLVDIIGGRTNGLDYFAHLVAGLFTFYFVSGSISGGAASVVGGGKLILNTAFPRLMLPFTAVLTAFFRFLPTMVVYAALHVAAGLPLGPHLLWVVPIFAIIAVFATGAAMIFAILQVYFRDTASFLPYLLRIWLYLSPVLWLPEDAARIARKLPWLEVIIKGNPLYPMLGSWSEVLTEGHRPAYHLVALGAAWAAVAFVLGAAFFMSRERDFAVRL